MIHRWFVKDTDNPPGQIVNPVGRPADTLQNNIEEWKRWEKERNGILSPDTCDCDKCDGSCMHD